eukprot:NODE_6504_length_529_cov_20.298507_g6339_i0.p1 GENE.NODE_6504_length_529_cov_20.298507_g6339_i0~~NODE_6504_length_529_cov_20.298507_g6339_i0.p1  ORF type:complete len:128 (+),score=36.32 NODE_6504_length_529_cov_20.298507_g6339_i0:58-441(+)
MLRTAARSFFRPSVLHLSAPETWTTDEVVAWLKTHTELDSSMEDTFRMARVDGNSLLHLTPNTLYKAMRRHHRRPEEPPTVTEEMLQETALLSFHYGASPPTAKETADAKEWLVQMAQAQAAEKPKE